MSDTSTPRHATKPCQQIDGLKAEGWCKLFAKNVRRGRVETINSDNSTELTSNAIQSDALGDGQAPSIREG